jgi:hypothetical protein
MTVLHETPAEYFKGLVESALEHQRLEASQLAAYYLVNLLSGFVRPGHVSALHETDEPMAVRLVRALEAGGAEQRARLRALGDLSLFTSGYFSDSLRRKLVDVDYYVALGGYAYGSLGREGDASTAVFAELSEKFVAFVDVLSEVSESSGLTSNADLLRTYEKWLRTGSPRSGRCLVERGIVPNASIGSRFLQ